MEEKKFSEERIERYEKAGYRILGEQKHSAIKVCRWAKESLRGKGDCYKKIFGVKSHRCIQMTPTLNLCNFSCGFCWRPFAENRHKAILDWDSPSAIIEDAKQDARGLGIELVAFPITSEKDIPVVMEGI